MSWLPIVLAVVFGALLLALAVAHLTRNTTWMRDLDERIYASKYHLLVPGGSLRSSPNNEDELAGLDLLDALIGGAPPSRPQEIATFDEAIPVIPSGRRRAR